MWLENATERLGGYDAANGFEVFVIGLTIQPCQAPQPDRFVPPHDGYHVCPHRRVLLFMIGGDAPSEVWHSQRQRLKRLPHLVPRYPWRKVIVIEERTNLQGVS